MASGIPGGLIPRNGARSFSSRRDNNILVPRLSTAFFFHLVGVKLLSLTIKFVRDSWPYGDHLLCHQIPVWQVLFSAPLSVHGCDATANLALHFFPRKDGDVHFDFLVTSKFRSSRSTVLFTTRDDTANIRYSPSFLALRPTSFP